MKKFYAFAFASLLASSTALVAGEGYDSDDGYMDEPNYGEVGCKPHEERFKNPGAMFKAARGSEEHAGANPADLAGALDLTVGGLLKAVCVEDPS